MGGRKVTSTQGDGRRQRTSQGRYVRTIESAERDAEAARMRSDGATYQQIADALGFPHRDLARRSVSRALAAIVAESAEELRTLELARLDEMWTEVMAVLRRSHVTVSQGRVIELDGVPLPDDAPVLQAIDRLLKIQDRRAKLLGLDAPAKHQVVTMDAVEAEIERLNRELADAAGTEAPTPA